jgi:hypothetical protein
MDQPQYYWQRADVHGSPIIDITEGEFDQLLEEMMEDLEAPEQPEAAP